MKRCTRWEKPFVLISLDTFRKYRYADISEGRVEITDYDYDRTQYDDELVTDKMKRDRLKYLSLFVAATPQEIDRLIKIFPDLEPIRRDINEFLERPKEVIGMFSEALRILDRNTAELMVDRMKNEMVVLKGQNDELGAKNNELTIKADELTEQNTELQAEVEKLKKLLEEQNK